MFLAKVNTLTLKCDPYPHQLAVIDTPPSQLFYMGAPPSQWLSQPRAAVVGSRKVTAYGRAVTGEITGAIADRGVIIISGLALGVDAIAHQAALKSGGITVAVLPTPLDQIYPSSHLGLARQIISGGGTLISEYPTGAAIFRQNFIARNRIVSGLADILLITEAAANSGTMHTARFALEQGKTVMTIPGNINQQGSEGCNNLIKSGALPVTEPDDILFALGLPPGKTISRRTTSMLSASQQSILSLIKEGIADQEELSAAGALTGAELYSALTMLEIAGHVRPLGGGRWVAS